ncbi:MAG: hypothetical protein HOP12_01000 [Candidatus Eisenbacteria bacterium]|uniref:T9SS type A sorting domain-containing protein n=1 Tax=Eiseniibacteriota bacterium TaxID=2212470 RepID=A0A849SLD6_UNCEI|nr:hypothetical protein [Candidatus Eisenbacteria bacterium]
MKNFRRIASAFGLVLSFQLLLADFVRAANLDWINVAGGAAGVQNNWNPAQVPAAIDRLLFPLNNTYTVTFGSAVPASDELGLRDGVVTFRFPTAHTATTLLGIAQTGDTAKLTIDTGSLTLLRNLYVAAPAGHQGTLTVTGSGTSVTASSATGRTSFGDQGAGIFNILDGATVTLANPPEFGMLPGGQGTLVVSGVSSTSPFPRSRFIVNNSSTDPMEIGTNGTGHAGVLFGAKMDVTGSMFMGQNFGGVGTLVVAGLGASDSARLNVGGNLHVAHNELAGTAANSGLFSVQSGGVADVAGSTYLFDPDGSAGELEIREGARFETGSLFVGNPATELDFTGGYLQVRGGTLDLNGNPLTIGSATGVPILELHDNAQAVINSPTAPALNVGGNGLGGLSVLYGSDLTVHDFNAIVGDGANNFGDLTMKHAGSSLIVDHALLVGRAGQGQFSASDGSQATVHSLGIATQPGSEGSVNILGTGTSVHVTDTFELAGLSSGASNAPGIVRVYNNADLWLDRPVISGNVWPTGELYVSSDAVLHLAGSLINRGVMDLDLGNTLGGVIQPIAGGQIVGSGQALSSIFAVADTTGRITPDGFMHLGSDTSPLGFHFLGTLDVPGFVVTLHDADSAVVGNVQFTGGLLNGPPGGIHVGLDKRVTGTGRISGPIRPVGRILSTGASGISFRGPVLGVGQGMNGTRFRFEPGSSFVGFGRLEASIQVDSGAVILPTSDVTLGRAPLASGVTIDGALVIGPGVEVDLNGTDSTRVNGLVAMTRGFIENAVTSPLLIRPLGRLAGNGTLVGTAVNNGTIDPGPSVNDLHFERLVMQSSSHTLFDVGNFAAGERDTITSSGSMTIAGALHLNALPNFTPVVGDSFQVLAYASHTGTFDLLTLNGVPVMNSMQIVYGPASAWVKIVQPIVDVPETPVASSGRALQFSSPGSPSRSLAFALELPEAAQVTIELFDVRGRRLTTLQDGSLSAGQHRFDANAPSTAGAGLYFARAVVRGGHETVVRTVRAVRLR